MKLTLKMKLLPSEEQSKLLLDTLEEANTACNAMSEIAWNKKLFNQYKLHHEVYHPFKGSFNLSAQMLVRCISKVTDSYKINRKKQRAFRKYGAIAYDSRILSYKPNDTVSIWCVGGRQKIPFICHNRNYLPYIKGEADLVYKKGKFFICQTVEVPEEDIEDVEEFIGVDFGITDIAVTSNGEKTSSEELNRVREKRQKVRSSIQSKGTRSSRKLLKRLSGKERTHATITNHTIAKQIVELAKEQGKGIALEDLTGIRNNSQKRNKEFRKKLGNWSFSQLRKFIEYKAQLNGVPVVIIKPAYTSQTCNQCKYIGKRTNKHFKCNNCGNETDADFNAALNIAQVGAAVNQPEKCDMYSCSVHH